MTAIVPFAFEDHLFRALDRCGEPWFIAGDVAKILGHRDASDLARSLDHDEKGTHSVRTPGGELSVTIVSEPGLYRAIIQRRTSTKLAPEVRAFVGRFQRWVFHEVLPSLRRIGSYSTGKKTVEATDPRRLSPPLSEIEHMNAQTRWITLVRQIYGRTAARHAYERSALPQVRTADAGSLYEAPEDDSVGCLKHLLRFAVGNGQSVRMAVDAAWRDETRRSWLNARGIKVVAGGRREHVAVAKRHPFLADAFADTPWADDWYVPLLGLDAAKASPSALLFEGMPSRQRAVLIPKVQVAIT